VQFRQPAVFTRRERSFEARRLARGVPRLPFACRDGRDIHQTESHMAMQFAIPQGMGLRITVTFSAQNENAVQIINQANGELIHGFNNYFGGAGTWESGINNSGAPQLIILKGIHKNTPPDGHEPWHPSPEKVLYSDVHHWNTIVGYEDGSDRDFNDARATLQYHFR
jgi:hypothetical protein